MGKNKVKKIQYPDNIPPTSFDRVICVDGAYSSSTGIMSYQGLSFPDGEVVFTRSFPTGTNNVAEFLGIVHALAYCKEQELELPIYSDSLTALSWVRDCKAKTILEDKKMLEIMDRAFNWLTVNKFPNKLFKWNTQTLGENYAHFGNKK